MNRRQAAATAASLAALAALAATPQAAFAAAGTGSVTDVLVASVLPGGLTIAGAGVNVALSSTPGAFSDAAGTTLLTMTDTTGTSNGWVVTAAYSVPTAVGAIDLGGENVKVTTSSVIPDALLVPQLSPSGLSPVTDAVLTSPVAVLTTGTATGAGISTARVGYKVKVPSNAQIGEVYGGKVTYTIASVR